MNLGSCLQHAEKVGETECGRKEAEFPGLQSGFAAVLYIKIELHALHSLPQSPTGRNSVRSNVKGPILDPTHSSHLHIAPAKSNMKKKTCASTSMILPETDPFDTRACARHAAACLKHRNIGSLSVILHIRLVFSQGLEHVGPTANHKMGRRSNLQAVAKLRKKNHLPTRCARLVL